MIVVDKMIERFKNNEEEKGEYHNKPIHKNMKKSIEYITDTFGNSSDLAVRTLTLKSKHLSQDIALVYLNGIVDQNHLNSSILESILHNFKSYYTDYSTSVTMKELRDNVFPFTEVSEGDNFGKLFLKLLGGEAIFLIDGFTEFFIIGSRMYKERAIESPRSHISVKGPQDAFTENYQTNISLIRRRLKNPKLWVKKFVIGTETNTDVAMLYLKGTAEESLVSEVEKRLKAAETSSILDSSFITYYIKDSQFSIFPTHMYDIERPDVATANLLEGRVVLVVDGSPFVLVAPTVFIQLFQSVEDFYTKSYVGTFFRILRMIGFYIALLLPAMYIALISMHSEVLPFPLLVQIAGQRENLPFPTFMEAIILGLIYDLLREASIRMPKALGSAISIVGALVLGEASVQAGIVSPIMVIVVSATAISTLVIPNFSLQQCVSILRYVFILLAVGFGLLGISIGILLLYLHLCSLRSFGTSYYVPFAPFDFKGQRDGLIRSPLEKIFKRKKNFSDKYPH